MTTDGIKLGGYTSQKWKKGAIIKDDNAFVFSLDKKMKYKITDPEKAIYINSWLVLDQWVIQYSKTLNNYQKEEWLFFWKRGLSKVFP